MTLESRLEIPLSFWLKRKELAKIPHAPQGVSVSPPLYTDFPFGVPIFS